jgi:hypothetical protein
MNDTNLYQFVIRGCIDADEINANSPLALQIIATPHERTLILASTDQAGMIGVIRHLHGLGLTILSVDCSTLPTETRSRS